MGAPYIYDTNRLRVNTKLKSIIEILIIRCIMHDDRLIGNSPIPYVTPQYVFDDGDLTNEKC